MAQLVAQRADNAKINGSSPFIPTIWEFRTMVVLPTPNRQMGVRIAQLLQLVVSRTTQWMDLTHPVSLLREDYASVYKRTKIHEGDTFFMGH